MSRKKTLQLQSDFGTVLWQAEKARVLTLADRNETETQPKTIRGILDTNAVGSSEHDDATLEDVLTIGEHYKIRLHVIFSRFNHSCVPNCYVEEFDITERDDEKR